MEHNMKLINSTASRGVTLVEIAIVLVIIGLLLGGILKGQELINNAKVRNIANRQQSLKIAWFAFFDRYQALPGDFVNDQLYIPGAGPLINVGIGLPGIAHVRTGDGHFTQLESPRVFQNLTGAGYLRCPQCTQSQYVHLSASNSPTNTYGGLMSIFETAQSALLGQTGRLLTIQTGARIPSNILSEIDRKLDDGIANTGDFVMNGFEPQSNGKAQYLGGVRHAGAGLCTTISPDFHDPGRLDSNVRTYWRHAQAEPPVEQNCGAATII